MPGLQEGHVALSHLRAEEAGGVAGVLQQGHVELHRNVLGRRDLRRRTFHELSGRATRGVIIYTISDTSTRSRETPFGVFDQPEKSNGLWKKEDAKQTQRGTDESVNERQNKR
jgi:hypothetical protein